MVRQVLFKTVETMLMRRLSLALVISLTAILSGNARAQVDEPFTGIRILSPVDGSVFKAPANIVVMIDGYDNPSTGHVIRLYEGSTVLYAIVLDPLVPITVVPVHFNFDFDWNDVRAGHYVLTAMIDDVTSLPVNVTVKRKHSHHH